MHRHPDFTTYPTSAQFAMDGIWERAWSFPCSSLPNEDTVRAYAAQRTEIAFESFHGNAFFGLRFEGEQADVTLFALDCVQALRASKQGSTFFKILCALRQIRALGEGLAFAEVGAVNAWRSVGAFRIEAPQYAASNFESVWTNLMQSSVAKDVRHRKAIEFAYPAPISHWFGIPVSADKEPYEIQPAALLNAFHFAVAE